MLIESLISKGIELDSTHSFLSAATFIAGIRSFSLSNFVHEFRSYLAILASKTNNSLDGFFFPIWNDVKTSKVCIRLLKLIINAFIDVDVELLARSVKKTCDK